MSLEYFIFTAPTKWKWQVFSEQSVKASFAFERCTIGFCSVGKISKQILIQMSRDGYFSRLLSPNDIIVPTYFLELFLLSVRGENSAALMTLVLDDILRKLCLLFSSTPLFSASFSSILTSLFCFFLKKNVFTATNFMARCGEINP